MDVLDATDKAFGEPRIEDREEIVRAKAGIKAEVRETQDTEWSVPSNCRIPLPGIERKFNLFLDFTADTDTGNALFHWHALTDTLGSERLNELRASPPHLFSDSMVLVAARDLDRMRAVIEAFERVVTLPGYRARVLTGAPDTARHDPHTPAVFMGYDFHLGPDGPRLIEINTNAGGALLNVALLPPPQS